MTYQVTFPAQVWQIVSHAMTTVEYLFDSRVYDTVPMQNTAYPCLVYQSQDLGGKNEPTIGLNGWNGFVTFRAIDYSLSGAYNLLALACADLANSVSVSGIITLSGTFGVQFTPDKPIPFPVEQLTEGLLYQAGVLVVVNIRPEV